MKRIFAFSFLAFFLVSNTEFLQLAKLPFLVIHYFEHKDQSPDLGFLEYVNHHYLNQDTQSDHTDKDHNLPFKSHGDACHFSVLSLPAETFSKNLVNIPAGLRAFNPTSEPVFIPSFFADIWHPPQIA